MRIRHLIRFGIASFPAAKQVLSFETQAFLNQKRDRASTVPPLTNKVIRFFED
jgi:hypothetical protein